MPTQAAAAARAGKERGKEPKEGDPPGPRKFTAEEAMYSEHPWNINNMPRCKARPSAGCRLRILQSACFCLQIAFGGTTCLSTHAITLCAACAVVSQTFRVLAWAMN